MYVFKCMYVCIYIYLQTNMHIYIFMYIYIYIYLCIYIYRQIDRHDGSSNIVQEAVEKKWKMNSKDFNARAMDWERTAVMSSSLVQGLGLMSLLLGILTIVTFKYSVDWLVNGQQAKTMGKSMGKLWEIYGKMGLMSLLLGILNITTTNISWKLYPVFSWVM